MLGPSDAPALSALLAEAPAPGPRIDRGADPFAHPRASGEPTYVGALAGGRLVAVAGAVAQLRYVGRTPQRTFYLCDARVAPEFRTTLAFALVLRALRTALGGARWYHAVVLENNPRLDRLAKGAPFFGAGRLLGRTRHVAWPTFLRAPWAVGGARLEETDAQRAAGEYARLAPARDFSPADDARFRGGGRFFVRRRGRAIAAVGKLVDESETRRIVSDAPPSLAATLLDRIARARGFPPMPKTGQPAALAYLSCYASDDHAPPAAFALAAAWIARTATHVCFGVAAAARLAIHPLAFQFTSRTYAYGDVPAIDMQSHELTWM